MVLIEMMVNVTGAAELLVASELELKVGPSVPVTSTRYPR